MLVELMPVRTTARSTLPLLMEALLLMKLKQLAQWITDQIRVVNVLTPEVKQDPSY